MAAALSAGQPDAAHSDFSPLVKSKTYSDEFQWKAIEACPRIGVRIGQSGTGSSVILAVKDRNAYALTAAHVIREGVFIDADLFSKISYPARDHTLTGVTVVRKNATADLALLRIPIGEKDPLPPTLKLAPAGQRPKKFPFAALSVGCDGGFSARCYEESVLAKRFVRRPEDQAAFFWETRDVPREGRSGGPLLDKDGNVIGICYAYKDDKGYFTHSDEIHAWIKQEKLEGFINPQSKK